MGLSFRVPGGWIFGPEVRRQRKLLYHPDKIHAWKIPAPTAQSVSPTVLQCLSAYLQLTYTAKTPRWLPTPKTQIIIFWNKQKVLKTALSYCLGQASTSWKASVILHQCSWLWTKRQVQEQSKLQISAVLSVFPPSTRTWGICLHWPCSF